MVRIHCKKFWREGFAKLCFTSPPKDQLAVLRVNSGSVQGTRAPLTLFAWHFLMHSAPCENVWHLRMNLQLLLNQHSFAPWIECYESVNLCTELILVHKKLLTYEWLIVLTQQRHPGIVIKTSAVDIPLPNHFCLSCNHTPRLLADYLEDFCDDGSIFCHCQVSHFKSCIVIL